MEKIIIFLSVLAVSVNSFSQAKIIGDFGKDAPYNKLILKVGYGSFPKILDSTNMINGKFEINIEDSILQKEPTLFMLAVKSADGKMNDLMCRNYINPTKRNIGFYPYKNVFYVSANFSQGKAFVYDLKPDMENDVYFGKDFGKSTTWKNCTGAKLDSLVGYVQNYSKSQYLIKELVFTKASLTTEQLTKLVGALDKEALQSKNGKTLSVYLQNRLDEDKHSQYKNLVLKNQQLKDETIFKDLKDANIIIFWASWCAPCRAEIPMVKRFYAKLKSKNANFQIVSISADEHLEKWQKSDKEVALPWRSLWSPDIVKLREEYNYSLPSNLLVTKDGKMFKIDLRNQASIDAVYKALGMPAEKFDYDEK